MSLTTEYRPLKWSEIVGQDHITETLINAVHSNKLHSGYLFVGQFGTGKTTTARLLAMTLNCQNRGEDMEPCGECNSCKNIIKGSSLDVKELDMATNRGIDDVRAIKEFAAYAPMGGRYRVFICDEAHALTPQGASALLKILEEPPKNVIFILCTTEIHKLMDTIRSRCQVHNFKRIDDDIIVARLTGLCIAENIEPEEGVLLEIAKASAGSMRQAESMLSNLVSAGTVSMELFKEMFGITSATVYQEFYGYMIQHDVASMLNRYDVLKEDIVEPSKWVEGLAAFLFDLMRKDEKNYKFYLGYLEIVDKYLVNIYQNQPGVYVKLLLVNLAQYEVKDIPKIITASITSAATTTPSVKDVADVWSLARWFKAIRLETPIEGRWFLVDSENVGVDVLTKVEDKDKLPYVMVEDIQKILRFPSDVDKNTLIDKGLIHVD